MANGVKHSTGVLGAGMPRLLSVSAGEFGTTCFMTTACDARRRVGGAPETAQIPSIFLPYASTFTEMPPHDLVLRENR